MAGLRLHPGSLEDLFEQPPGLSRLAAQQSGAQRIHLLRDPGFLIHLVPSEPKTPQPRFEPHDLCQAPEGPGRTVLAEIGQ